MQVGPAHQVNDQGHEQNHRADLQVKSPDGCHPVDSSKSPTTPQPSSASDQPETPFRDPLDARLVQAAGDRLDVAVIDAPVVSLLDRHEDAARLDLQQVVRTFPKRTARSGSLAGQAAVVAEGLLHASDPPKMAQFPGTSNHSAPKA